MRLKIPKILRWTAALLTIVLAAALCVQCIRIYAAGPAQGAAGGILQSAFTREKASAHLRPLIPLALVWAGSMIAAGLTGQEAPRRPAMKRTPPPQEMRGLTAVRIALAVAGAALTVLGVLNGGMYDVLVKAINICTECIGLG